MEEDSREMFAFISSKDEDMLDVANVTPIQNKDPFMRIQKIVRVATVQSEQPDEEDKDEEEIPITRLAQLEKIATKPSPKRKYIASSPENTKKTKEPQTSEVPKRKRKLLSAASSATKNKGIL